MMPTFRCKIQTPDGRVIEKTLIAANKSSLTEHLERQGDFVVDIRRVEGLGPFLKQGRARRRVKRRDFQVFNQEFSVLIKAGLPILQALDTIIDKRPDDEFKEVLSEIRHDVSGGSSLSEAFDNYSHIFSRLYTATLQAGEKSGDVGLAVTRYIEYQKKTVEIRQKVIKASVYPVILTVVSVFVVFFLLLYVVPSFTETYFESGTELPGLTMTLIGISNIVKSNIMYLTALPVLFAIGYRAMKRTGTGTSYVDKLKLKLPFFGDIYVQYALSKLTRTLATVLRGGMPLLNSLQISSGAVGNHFLKMKLDEATLSLEKGAGFSESLSATGAFPRLALSMIEAGESSGSLEFILDEMADFYESNVDMRLAVLTSAIEPALMIMMGLLIGFIVLAMYLPIFQMASVVG